MRFSKWHALGNAYLLVERAEVGRALAPGDAKALCDSHDGVGADGVLEVSDVTGAEATVLVWNPDGSRSELSGNGARIAAMWLARRSGVAFPRVRMGERTIAARVAGDEVEVDLGSADVGAPEVLVLNEERLEFTPVSVGNPHAVFRREPTRDELLRLGPLVERHERFPERTNVQLARADGESDVTVLVWERGVGETRSSGSSAAAVAAAAVAHGWCSTPVCVHLPGGPLEVDIREGRAVLRGPAVEIFRGETV
jgi:diaminopimelate epimerase